MLAPWKKIHGQPREHIKKQRHYFANKGPSSQSYGFLVVMYGYESWTIRKADSWRINWCFWIVVLEKTLESPLECKEIKPFNSKGNQSWIFIGRTDAEAEAPILWPLDAKNWLMGKDPDAGRDWRQEKATTEDEMVGWHRWTWVWANSGSWWWTGKPGVLQSTSHKDSDTTERLNWTELNWGW